MAAGAVMAEASIRRSGVEVDASLRALPDNNAQRRGSCAVSRPSAISMTDRLPIRPGLSIPMGEIELRTSRSSGPGGQHANVTASRVEAVFDVGAAESLSEAQRARISGRLGPRVTASA